MHRYHLNYLILPCERYDLVIILQPPEFSILQKVDRTGGGYWGGHRHHVRSAFIKLRSTGHAGLRNYHQSRSPNLENKSSWSKLHTSSLSISIPELGPWGWTFFQEPGMSLQSSGIKGSLLSIHLWSSRIRCTDAGQSCIVVWLKRLEPFESQDWRLTAKSDTIWRSMWLSRHTKGVDNVSHWTASCCTASREKPIMRPLIASIEVLYLMTVNSSQPGR